MTDLVFLAKCKGILLREGSDFILNPKHFDHKKMIMIFSTIYFYSIET